MGMLANCADGYSRVLVILLEVFEFKQSTRATIVVVPASHSIGRSVS